MIWLITIVTFLSAIIAVMLVYWFILQREQILAALRSPEEHRMEARIPRRVGLELSCPGEPLIYETTFTENVSRHGARVVTKRHWSPNDSVLVKLPQESLPARARITYCQPSKGDEFAMGLQFSLVIYDWAPRRLLCLSLRLVDVVKGAVGASYVSRFDSFQIPARSFLFLFFFADHGMNEIAGSSKRRDRRRLLGTLPVMRLSWESVMTTMRRLSTGSRAS
jgi:hypothetical protein